MQALEAGGVSAFPMMTLPDGERYGEVKDPARTSLARARGAKIRRGGELSIR
jgi:hypothetical protein